MMALVVIHANTVSPHFGHPIESIVVKRLTYHFSRIESGLIGPLCSLQKFTREDNSIVNVVIILWMLHRRTHRVGTLQNKMEWLWFSCIFQPCFKSLLVGIRLVS
ncbi:hypothetical protein Cflav_PD2292 [Pedosphaera parvula Ellin514]|uniref:Uncharacterized protein n=1 Tax=Pedosphaera parvula (strain Ellin514) TaxID=320771 RepID=B9XL97_PEDPL|nr:hypothetical protein Cflav_PD2292 [Pedosphaera parvula Ellin514]